MQPSQQLGLIALVIVLLIVSIMIFTINADVNSSIIDVLNIESVSEIINNFFGAK
jgi:hypothetical protein